MWDYCKNVYHWKREELVGPKTPPAKKVIGHACAVAAPVIGTAILSMWFIIWCALKSGDIIKDNIGDYKHKKNWRKVTKQR
ncbi:MAG: hypothetical protein FWE64_00785 [Alphaproteobacteria bacterium]|nr:hypothetical protein [Alphaproteobacteria bacterium]